MQEHNSVLFSPFNFIVFHFLLRKINWIRGCAVCPSLNSVVILCFILFISVLFVCSGWFFFVCFLFFSFPDRFRTLLQIQKVPEARYRHGYRHGVNFQGFKWMNWRLLSFPSNFSLNFTGNRCRFKTQRFQGEFCFGSLMWINSFSAL